MKRYDKEFKERTIELSGEVGLKKASADGKRITLTCLLNWGLYFAIIAVA